MKERDKKCSCIDIAMGSYDNQISLKAPDWSRHNIIGIDACIAIEVWNLWKIGIVTTGCCCGHNIAPPYIGVELEFIPMMKDMGYKVQLNNIRPGDKPPFIPMSLTEQPDSEGEEYWNLVCEASDYLHKGNKVLASACMEKANKIRFNKPPLSKDMLNG